MGTTFVWSPDVVSMLTHWALPFLVVLGVLVAFHEAGHFLAARWVGVKVLKFSSASDPRSSAGKLVKPNTSFRLFRSVATSSSSARTNTSL